MAAAALPEAQTQVRFTTRLEPRLRVSEAPIQLPTRLTRYGLSEVVNHLLSPPATPFDFVAPDGQLQFAAGTSGFFRTTDGWSTWTRIATGVPNSLLSGSMETAYW